MKLYTTLEQQLKKEPNFVTDNGELKKWVVLNKAQNFDEELIGLLLDNADLKEKFFVNVKGTLVFNQNLFVQFLEQKNYLNDSYTQYKNKVGLTIDGKYLKQRNEVALVWPFKDCILEGGQSREEDKREEIFFNEILAQDEITQLLEPKVITNVTLVQKDKSNPYSINIENFFDVSNNYLVKGNNLLVGHSLAKKFKNKTKLVYLDPPYNTPGEANTFSYNNSFNHSTWLTFMKNRIEIAKELLSDDGFMCLAIDDVEGAYLKVLADDIFGRDNYIATVIVQIKKEGRTDSEFFATSHDYAIFYAKNKSKAKINNLAISEETSKKWKEGDNTGRYYWRDFVRTGGNATPLERPNQDFIIYYSETLEKIVGVGGKRNNKPNEDYQTDTVFIIDTAGDCIEIESSMFKMKHKKLMEFKPLGSNGERQVWRWSDREKILWACEMGEIAVLNGKIKIKDRIRQGSKPTTTWYDSEFNATSHGTLLLKKLFNGKKVFSYPKSLYTMIDIIQVTTNENDLIIDFFGGSATTAHAVCKVNELDNGSRNFIIVEQMDYIKTATLPRIQKCLNNSTNNFIYLELKSLNQKYLEAIDIAKNTNEIIALWTEIKAKSFLNYNVDIKKHDEHLEEFKTLSLTEQKQHLCELLDKNQLYVNLSSLNDADFACTEEEKKITIDFYQIKK